MRSLSFALMACVAVCLSSAGCKRKGPLIGLPGNSPTSLPPSTLRSASWSNLTSRAFDEDSREVMRVGIDQVKAGLAFKQHEKQALASSVVLALADGSAQPTQGVAGALLPLAALAGHRAGAKTAKTQFVFRQSTGPATDASSNTFKDGQYKATRTFTRSFTATRDKVESGLNQLKKELLELARRGQLQAEEPADERTAGRLSGFRIRYVLGEAKGKGEVHVAVTGGEKSTYALRISLEETAP